MWFWFGDALQNSLRKWNSAWCQITLCIQSNNWVSGECEKPDNLCAPCPAGERHGHEGSMNKQAYSWDTQASICVILKDQVWSWFLKLASLLSHGVLAAAMCDGINKPQLLYPAPQVSDLSAVICSLNVVIFPHLKKEGCKWTYFSGAWTLRKSSV